jgi:Cohesin domain/Dockerin type I domain
MKKTNTLGCVFFLSFFTTLFSPSFIHAQCTSPDTTKPVARCKNTTIFLDSTGQGGVDPRQVDGGSRDNCSTWYLILNHPCYYCSDVGNNNLTLYVQDRAGNTATCQAVVTVRDTTRPKLVLRSNITATLNEPTGTLNAQQLVSSVTDNCSALNKIQLGMRKVGTGLGFPTSSTLTLACKDTGKVNIEIWARDSSGNTESKTTTIIVKSANNVCTPVIVILPTPMIVGAIRNEVGRAISANVSLSGGNSQSSIILKNSDYRFDNLTRGGNYTLTPVRDTDVTNGVTTFDIALMSRHALDVEPFTSPYKLIAGDVNKDGVVDAIDMVTTRKIILRQINRFPNNTSWRFVPNSYVFPIDTTNGVPSRFPEVISVNNINDTLKNADFMAIKIGDVNFTANNLTSDMPIQVRSDRKWNLHTEDKVLQKGDIYSVDIETENAAINAFQFTLNYDKKLLQILDIQAIGLDNFETSNYALFVEKGMATVSWNGLQNNTEAQPKLFRIMIKAVQNTKLSNALLLSSDLTTAEAYTQNGDNYSINLQFKSKNTEGGDNFTIFPNVPNPFTDATTIRFRLSKEETVRLTVFDETGRILKTINNSFSKGYNEIALDMRNNAITGVLYYRLETPTHFAVQKMVILK